MPLLNGLNTCNVVTYLSKLGMGESAVPACVKILGNVYSF
jgi:hypothetical protein